VEGIANLMPPDWLWAMEWPRQILNSDTFLGFDLDGTLDNLAEMDYDSRGGCIGWNGTKDLAVDLDNDSPSYSLLTTLSSANSSYYLSRPATPRSSGGNQDMFSSEPCPEMARDSFSW
jgi:hypothetical protein